MTEDVTFPTRHISIEYYANPNPDAKDHILSEFGIADVADVNDLSDLAIVEEQVQQLRYLYSTAIGDLTASGTVLQWINDFYTNHSEMCIRDRPMRRNGRRTLHRIRAAGQ